MLPRYQVDGRSPLQVTAFGATPGELFENVAFSLFDVRFDTDPPRIDRDVAIVAVGDTLEELLADWLDVVVRRSVDLGLILVAFSVDRLEQGGVQGVAAGYWSDKADQGVAPTVPVVVEIPDGFWARYKIPDFVGGGFD